MPPVYERMVFTVIQLVNSIANVNGSFDALRDDLLMNLVTNDGLAKRGNNRAIHDRTVPQDRPMIANPGTFAEEWPIRVARSRRQLAGSWTIGCGRIEKIVQPITIHGLTGANNARQFGRLNCGQIADRRSGAADGSIPQDGTVAGRKIASDRPVTRHGPRWSRRQRTDRRPST